MAELRHNIEFVLQICPQLLCLGKTSAPYLEFFEQGAVLI